jgi:hypothetical protein
LRVEQADELEDDRDDDDLDECRDDAEDEDDEEEDEEDDEEDDDDEEGTVRVSVFGSIVLDAMFGLSTEVVRTVLGVVAMETGDGRLSSVRFGIDCLDRLVTFDGLERISTEEARDDEQAASIPRSSNGGKGKITLDSDMTVCGTRLDSMISIEIKMNSSEIVMIYVER